MKDLTFNLPNSPLIVIGMSRSGTTVLTRLLAANGFFMGNKRTRNEEAEFFFWRNKRILRHYGEYWYNGNNTIEALKNSEEQSKMFNQHIKYSLREFETSYLGYFLMLKRRIKHLKNFQWGWKDPRNTITIDFWKTLFPKAMILGIIRHPFYAALSLYYFELKRYKGNLSRGKPAKFIFDPAFCFRIWEFYVEQMLLIKEKYPGDVMLIQYEELSNDKTVDALLQFTGIQGEKKKLKHFSANPSDYSVPETFHSFNRLMEKSDLVQYFNYSL